MISDPQSVMSAIVTLIACSRVGDGLDASQDNALMAAASEGDWQKVEIICTDDAYYNERYTN